MNRNRILSLNFLRRVLALDAISSALMGLGLVIGAEALTTLTGIPQDLSFGAGVSLLPFALFVGFLATREHPSRAGVWIVIAVNALWAIESVVLLFSDGVAPNLLGSIFIAGQAIVVGVFAELQYVGLRKQRLLAA